MVGPERGRRQPVRGAAINGNHLVPGELHIHLRATNDNLGII